MFSDESMDLDGPKRRSSGGGLLGNGKDPRRMLEEVAEDLVGILPDVGIRLFDKLRFKLEGLFQE